ncbi:hypothetical protein BU24DRAFT_417402 [Aaosphaeria arxii CBS 175.79]|uniref:Uncharacterized protein n=1 Tax=Aaosphaeria arxii CBS 175.79 TaxID=1450172 RepID=A0A6A5YAF7_9PLEO|nr:uncharacterized protein BU24DRAFT_417402 [Aaosphaeria arxii CBS 175.79]KAF2021780.1 hypothetical protein BU24DRAFT_417402 [Aaosphaeria arxii CBS 175.79]
MVNCTSPSTPLFYALPGLASSRLAAVTVTAMTGSSNAPVNALPFNLQQPLAVLWHTRQCENTHISPHLARHHAPKYPALLRS